MKKPIVSIVFAAALAGCGGGNATRTAPPQCTPANCPGTGYLAVAEPNGIALFASPFTGAARASIPLAGAESITGTLTVDTPRTLLVGVAPNKVYTYDYPYAAADGSYTLPVNDLSQMAFVSWPMLIVADAVSNDLALVDLSANPPMVTQTVTGLKRPSDFAFDMQGNLWVTEASDVAVFAIATDGTFTRTGTITAGLSAPDGLFRYYDGSMYVADAGNNAIEVFAPNTTVPAFAVTSGLNRPRSLLDAFGNMLFVANTGDNSIAAFSLPLTSTSAPLWISHNLSGTPRVLTQWFSPSF